MISIRNSKKSLLSIILACIVSTSTLCFSEEIESTIELNQSPVFGFSPSMYFNINISEQVNIIPYAEFWFQNSFKDSSMYVYPGIEFGLGAEFALINKKLFLTPSIGIYNGNTYSGSYYLTVFDAFVPSIKIKYQVSERIDMKLDSRIWIQGRKNTTTRYTFDFSEIYAQVNFKFNKLLKGGFFYNHLITNEKYYNSNQIYSNIFVFGPSVTICTTKLSMNIGIGADMIDYIDSGNKNKSMKEYYKMNARIKL